MATLYEFSGSQGGTWPGEDNTFEAPDNEFNTLFGDVTETLEGFAIGGDDTLLAGDYAVNFAYGDALRLFGNAQGGNDTVVGGAYSENYLRGEANAMHDSARGGDDLLVGGIHSIVNNMNGDAIAMYETTEGGDDTLIGGDGSLNLMRGDALFMNHSAQGGDDLLVGGDNGVNELYGEAREMFGASQGGDDTVIGGFQSGNALFGDAGDLYEHSQGGDDLVIGGENGLNYLYGDADRIADDARGGNDTLAGGDDSTNYMYGDAAGAAGEGGMHGNAQGGDDRLESGTGADHMWGDAALMADNAQGGYDTFVFAADSGQDVIYDFEQGKDHVDLSALELLVLPGHVPAGKMPAQGLAGLMKAPPTLAGFEVLDSNGNGVLDDGDDYVSTANEGADTVVDLGAAAGGAAGEDVLTVVGVTALVEADFFF